MSDLITSLFLESWLLSSEKIAHDRQIQIDDLHTENSGPQLETAIKAGATAPAFNSRVLHVTASGSITSRNSPNHPQHLEKSQSKATMPQVPLRSQIPHLRGMFPHKKSLLYSYAPPSPIYHRVGAGHHSTISNNMTRTTTSFPPSFIFPYSSSTNWKMRKDDEEEVKWIPVARLHFLRPRTPTNALDHLVFGLHRCKTPKER
jgi:hypothetical protein